MRLGLNFGYWGSGPSDNIAIAQEAERLGYHSLWTAEAYGSDSVSPLVWLAAHTERINVGTAIMQMPARTPAMTAMTAMTLDALGLEKPQPQQTQKSASTDGEVSEEDVWNQLRQCYGPEIPVNIVDLGLVYDCRLSKKQDGGTKVEVKMTLTAPGCGMGPAIAHDAQSKILSIDGVDEADVQLVWDPPWNQNMISEAGRMKLGMV